MKKFRPLLLLLITVGTLASSSTVYAQSHCDLLQVNSATAAVHVSGLGFWSIYKASKGA